MTLALAWLLFARPDEAIVAAAHHECVDAVLLRRLCDVESHCKPLGPHAHAKPYRRIRGWRAYRRAVAAGLLHPEACEHHQQAEDSERWGVRGYFGLVAALHLHLLGQPCARPEALDLAYPAALVAARHLRRLARMVPEDKVLTAWRVGVGAARRDR